MHDGHGPQNENTGTQEPTSTPEDVSATEAAAAAEATETTDAARTAEATDTAGAAETADATATAEAAFEAATAGAAGAAAGWRGTGAGADAHWGDVPDGAKKHDMPPETKPHGLAEKALEWTGLLAPLVFALIVAAHVWHGMVAAPGLCPSEARSLSVVGAAIQNGAWLAPSASGAAMLPVYVWYVAGCEKLLELLGMPGLQAAAALGTGIAALIALLSIYLLTRWAGRTRGEAAAAGLVAGCAPIFMAFMHHAGPQSLGVALVLGALGCFCRGFQSPHFSFLFVVKGFILSALAGLTQGLAFLLVAPLAAFIHLFWQGRPGRLQKADALGGFTLMLVIVAGWLAAVTMFSGSQEYAAFLSGLVPHNPMNAPDYGLLPLLLAALGLGPWLLVILCVNWGRVAVHAFSDLRRSRQVEDGTALCWIAFVLGCALAVTFPDPPAMALLCGCLACPLIGKALLGLSGTGSRLFHGMMVIILALAGLVAIAAGFGMSRDLLAQAIGGGTPGQWLAAAGQFKWIAAMGGALLVAAAVLAKFVDLRRPAAGLIACAVLSLLLAQPAMLLLGPELATIEAPSTPATQKAAPAPAEPAAVPEKAPDAAKQAAPDAGAADKKDAGASPKGEKAPGADAPAATPPAEKAPADGAPAKAAPEAATPAKAAPEGTAPAKAAPEGAASEKPAPEKAAPEKAAPEAAAPASDAPKAPAGDAKSPSSEVKAPEGDAPPKAVPEGVAPDWEKGNAKEPKAERQGADTPASAGTVGNPPTHTGDGGRSADSVRPGNASTQEAGSGKDAPTTAPRQSPPESAAPSDAPPHVSEAPPAQI
ncbi:MAG: hypothetical protein LBR22_03190 [Desulfovibrio sp.]|nr:hypothetical protein [Desulfovibrio sp.]